MKTVLPAAVLTISLTACAGIGHQSFYANPSAASPFEMCKTLVSGAPDMDFANALRMELGRRGVAEAACPDVIKKRETMVAVGVAAGVVALAVAANRHSDVEIGVGTTFGVYGAETYPSGPAPVADHDWAWDQYRGSNGSAIWACRGLPSGALSDPSRCEGKPLSDTTWPGDSPAFR
ncbi:hypothetical protein GTP41_21555 [Pseudoduganella sp. DS3]|uniref:Lipoprotein n=1 Tax=Pseudoduganella guangdongensis TaxID=2692179 RepID=A0A6N9HPV1_9BURK|nr:hypothetical protein [Pseudoduganella guangdongensis]MYN04685.1 hypothetical protein [Pseudoduganella guangdongensis]